MAERRLGSLIRKVTENLGLFRKEPEMVQIYLRLICGDRIPSRLIGKNEPDGVVDLIETWVTAECPWHGRQRIIDWDRVPVQTPPKQPTNLNT